jgi:hypothetical protein
MRRFRLLSILSAMLVGLAMMSCSEQSTSVEPPREMSPEEVEAQQLLGTLIGLVGTTTETLLNTTTGLLGSVLACPNYRHYETQQTVGPYGGYIQAGPASLYIPPGALDRYVTITATVPRDSRATYVQFEPHGLQFERPTALTMSYSNCGLLSSPPKQIVYVDENKDLQILEALPSIDDRWRRRVTGKVDHFSSYAVSERSSSRDRYNEY